TAMVLVDAHLVSTSGLLVASGRGRGVLLPQGTAPVVVHFDGRDISAAGIDGPFNVDQVSVASDKDAVRSFSRLAYRAHAHITSFFDHTRFAPCPHIAGLIEYEGVPVSGASVRIAAAGQAAIPDSAGRYHLNTPEFRSGTFAARLSLPAGFDTTGWR